MLDRAVELLIFPMKFFRGIIIDHNVGIDPMAFEETAVREATRVAVRRAIGVAVEGRDPDAARDLVARRDEVTSPFYGGS